MLFVRWKTVKPNPQFLWWPCVHICWQIWLLYTTVAYYMHMQVNSHSIHTGTFSNEQVSNIMWNVLETRICMGTCHWQHIVVHELLTVHHTCTIGHYNCVLRCIFVTDILMIVCFHSMLFVMWKILKPMPPLFIMAICSHTLTIPTSTLHAHA